MAAERVKRRLAAIVATDVAGYSRLMERDEAGTLDRLQALRREAVDPRVADYGGRLVKSTGDGLLLEFASVVNAVAAMVELQRDLAAREARQPEERRIALRVGVHLGDVIADDEGDIFGDGVNLAARLQQMAEPGEICLSGAAYDAVLGKLEEPFEDLGLRAAKNIARPLQVWRWRGFGGAPAAPALALPRRPSIIVLPFDNLSGTPDQDVFADGMTEDITTALSRLRWLFVIARNSAFTYKGRAVDVKHVAREMGVRYVLEGSVRAAGPRIRVTAQLIEAASANHLWGERYDCGPTDLFDVQDDISHRIAAAIAMEVEQAESRRVSQKVPGSLDAWEAYHRGLAELYTFTPAGLERADAFFRRSIELDPDFAPAFARLAYARIQQFWYGPHDARPQRLQEALEAARRAVALDERDPLGHFSLGRALALTRQSERALAELRLAVELSPSFAQAHFGLAQALVYARRHDEAIASVERAIRLSPFDLHRWTFHLVHALALFGLGQPEEALGCARLAVQQPRATYWAHATLTALLGACGMGEAAQESARTLAGLLPGYSLAYARRDLEVLGDVPLAERYVEGLRRAGVPE